MPNKTKDKPTKKKTERPTALGTIGARINYARRVVGMTQQELAARTGKARTTLAQYESNAIDPSVEALDLIAKALAVRPEFLAFGTSDLAGRTTYHTGPSIRWDGNAKLPPLVTSKTQTAVLKIGPVLERSFLVPVEHDAPEFGFSAGEDTLIVDTSVKEAAPDRRIYLLESSVGIEPMRCEPRFGQSNALRFTGPDGQTYELTPSDVRVQGVVLGSIKMAPDILAAEDS